MSPRCRKNQGYGLSFLIIQMIYVADNAYKPNKSKPEMKKKHLVRAKESY